MRIRSWNEQIVGLFAGKLLFLSLTGALLKAEQVLVVFLVLFVLYFFYILVPSFSDALLGLLMFNVIY